MRGTTASAMCAIGYGYGYDEIFARELGAIGKKGHLFIPITTGGNSINILKAVDLANEMGFDTTCLTGDIQGGIKLMCNSICIPSKSSTQIRECHIMTVALFTVWSKPPISKRSGAKRKNRT